MAEILIMAVNKTHPNETKDRQGSYKVGMPVVVEEDNHKWGAKECPPTFYLIKIPTIAAYRVRKFVAEQTIDLGQGAELYRRRRWQIRVSDLPQAAINLFQANGEIIIRAGSYSGPYDYTWNQVKNYFRNLETGLDGAEIDGR